MLGRGIVIEATVANQKNVSGSRHLRRHQEPSAPLATPRLDPVDAVREHAGMLPDQLRPLNATDLARLERFLHSAACGKEAMGLSYAHGFLTAVASGPEQLDPDEWLRLMFDEPVFESGDDAKEMLGLAMRLLQETERSLRDKSGFRPVFDFVRRSAGDSHADAQRWCLGFVSGFALFSERWTRDARGALHAPLALIFELSQMRSRPDPAYARLCDAVPEAAESVYRYWHTAEGKK